MPINHYNNLAINSFSLHSVLNERGSLSLPEITLILPIIAHKGMLLSIKKYKKRINFMEYFIENINFFYNFNERYEDSLINTINSIQFLVEVDVVGITQNNITLKKSLPSVKEIGDRAKDIRQASKNLAALISDDVNAFYLHARISL